MRAGEASTTARRVAAQRLSFTRVTAGWGRPDDEDRLQSDVAAGIAAPTSFMTKHLQERTLFVDQMVVDGIQRGVSQIVVVGAGYDGRSLRYAKPGVRWYEIDHPSTQSDKLARLARLAVDVSSVGFAAADFAVNDVADALGRLGQRADEAALFVCEGVAAYLERPVLESLLGALGRRAAAGSTLTMTLSIEARDLAGRLRRQALAEAVARMGEPMSAPLPPEQVVPLLSRAGWELSPHLTRGSHVVATRGAGPASPR